MSIPPYVSIIWIFGIEMVAFLATNAYNRIMEPENVNDYLKINQKDETFSELLLRLIRESGMDEVDIYKRAYIDRKFFSKIRSDRNYRPKKINVLALALALKLDSKTSKTLIKRAGYILTSGSEFDLVIRFCIENKIYDLYDVNKILLEKGLPIFD
jgi:hypothetical protein